MSEVEGGRTLVFRLCLCRCLSSSTKPKNGHFDRSCSQSHREQRSGEIRFSTSTPSQPQRRRLSSTWITTARVPHPSRSHREGWDVNHPPSPAAEPLLLSLPFVLLSQPQNNRHFDRSCSQSHREQRSGEIRFSTSTPSQPQRRRLSSTGSQPPGCPILRGLIANRGPRRALLLTGVEKGGM
jgi:hypothetical protein